MEGNGNYDRKTPSGAKLAMGILMVLVYIGVGLLFIFNVFMIDNAVLSYVIGGLLCLYGVFRAIRLYRGN